MVQLSHPHMTPGKSNIISDSATIPAVKYQDIFNYGYGVSVYSSNQYGLLVRQSNTSLTTATAINNYLSSNPLTVYYELATPQEIDISAYLTDDNLIEVEAGGSLTFPNSNGTDYQIPVPSAETYMVDLQSAI